ncbi:MAG: FitA-like ribbon-helix-helix domain-containing protein [Mycobacteriales bacterium]
MLSLAVDVLIRDLPEEVHAELVRRAAAEDKSLRSYLRGVLTEHVAVPSIDQWLQRLRELGPTHAVGPTGAELVAAARAEDDELLGR